MAQGIGGSNQGLLRMTLTGDWRYLSHRDWVRMIERALVRAQIPVAYSQGFNPRIRLSFPLPRPVGMSGEDEPVVVGLSQAIQPDEFRTRLNEQLPSGIRADAVLLEYDRRRSRIGSVSYELELADSDCIELQERITVFMNSNSAWVDREPRKGLAAERLDVRPFVLGILLQKSRLQMTTQIVNGRPISIRDLIGALGLDWNRLRHRFHRKKVEWIL